MQLNDSEKQAAAQACRVAAMQAELDAAKQSNPDVRATFESIATRYRSLASKLENDREPQRLHSSVL